MTSLVTGAAGFIGSHVAQSCIQRGHTVIAYDDLSGGFLDNIPAGAYFVKGSITSESQVNTLFEQFRFDHVYHLAAYAAEGLSHFIRRFNYTNNLIGTVNLINAAVNTGTVKRFVFTSSIAVYGSGQVPMTEEMAPSPEDPYGISKYAIELDLKAAQQMFGLNYTIFRPHNVYGERQNIGDRYRNVIGIFMNQIMKGEPMTIFGDGQQTRAFSHINDVAPIIAGSVEHIDAENQTFNIGSEASYSVLELAHIVAGALGVVADIRFVESRKEVVHAYSRHDRLKSVFGCRPTVSLEEGVRRMAEWARATGPRTAPIYQTIEVQKGLPASWARDIQSTAIGN